MSMNILKHRKENFSKEDNADRRSKKNLFSFSWWHTLLTQHFWRLRQKGFKLGPVVLCLKGKRKSLLVKRYLGF